MTVEKRKILRVGNSKGVMIPMWWLKEKGLDVGDEVLIKMDQKIIIDPDIYSVFPTEEEVHEEAKKLLAIKKVDV